MDTSLLSAKFARLGARLGARLVVAGRPARRGRSSNVLTLDVRADRAGEFFKMVRPPGAGGGAEAIDV